ncbi:hypothetical protein V6N13_059184 [Hibiscus sabdariffa]
MGQCHSRASSSTEEEEEEVHCEEEEEEEEETSSMKKGCLSMAKEQRSRFYILRRYGISAIYNHSSVLALTMEQRLELSTNFTLRVN